MSLEANYVTEIVVPKTQLVSFSSNMKESPCMEILRLAMEKVIRDKGGRLDASYTDSQGRNNSCVLSVRTGDFEKGVGAIVSGDGKVVFRYEAQGDVDGKGRAICDEINRNYNVIAVMRAQKRLGFNVSVSENRTGSGSRVVTVTGVR